MNSNAKYRALQWGLIKSGVMSFGNVQDGDWALPQYLLHQADRVGIQGCLPPFTKQLVEELHYSLDLPVAAVVSQTLPAIASGVQLGYVVQCPGHEPMPPSIFGLALLKSAKGKSELIDALKRPHIEAMSLHGQEKKDEMRHAAEILVWKAKIKEKQREIRRNVKSPEAIETLTSELAMLIGSEPKLKQLGTNLVVMNVTKEALQYGFFQEGPATTLAHDEASWFFKEFGSDFTPITQGYDGKGFTVGRRSSESFGVDWQCLSLMLGIQTGRMDRLTNSRGLELVESGLIPRMLIGLSEEETSNGISPQLISTAGRDRYASEMRLWFERYIHHLKAGTLKRVRITFDDQAQKQWLEIKRWLVWAGSENGPLRRIAEFALRCAQHIARVATLFHVYEGRGGTHISLETLQQATLVVRDFSRRYEMLFGDVHLEESERDANPILCFLLDRFLKSNQNLWTFECRYIYQSTWGGREVRSRDRVYAALQYLIEQGVLEWSPNMGMNYVQFRYSFRSKFGAYYRGPFSALAP